MNGGCKPSPELRGMQTSLPKITPCSFPGTTPTVLGKRHPYPSALASPSSLLTQAKEKFCSPCHHQPLLSDHSVAGVGDVIASGSRIIYPPSCKPPASSAFASLTMLPCFFQPNFSDLSHHHSRLLCKAPYFTGRFLILISPFIYRAIVQLPSS